MPNDPQIIDIKFHLERRFPVFFELLGDGKLDWNRINKTYHNQQKKYVERFYRINRAFGIEPSIYNIITNAKKGDVPSQRVRDFIQKLFEELVAMLDAKEKKAIKATLFGLLCNIDRKFLNFLGELAVLHQHKKRRDFRLYMTEAPIDNDKKGSITADFLLLDEPENTIWHIEVVNIHLKEKDTLDDEKIRNMLTQKIEGKIASKQMKSYPYVFLAPVIWGTSAEIKKVTQYYEKHDPKFYNTLVPSCWMTLVNDKGQCFHKFSYINTITKGLNLIN